MVAAVGAAKTITGILDVNVADIGALATGAQTFVNEETTATSRLTASACMGQGSLGGGFGALAGSFDGHDYAKAQQFLAKVAFGRHPCETISQ